MSVTNAAPVMFTNTCRQCGSPSGKDVFCCELCCEHAKAAALQDISVTLENILQILRKKW